MKTLALTIAAAMIASTSAFAGNLFDVNDAPAQYEAQQQMLDSEATASIGSNAASVSGNYMPFNNDALFDVSDR